MYDSRNDAAYGEQEEAVTPVYLNTYYSPFLGWKVRYMIYVSYIRREIERGAGGGEYFKSKQFVSYEQFRCWVILKNSICIFIQKSLAPLMLPNPTIAY